MSRDLRREGANRYTRPAIFDCRVASPTNCFPMFPSGKAHNDMLMGEAVSDEEVGKAIGKEGKMLV